MPTIKSKNKNSSPEKSTLDSKLQIELHERFMQKAFSLAKKGADRQEVPVAALLIKNGAVVARAHNLTRNLHDPTAHAEMLVIQDAARKLKNERLLDTTLYVTLEPCAMCAGAIVQARIPLVVYATRDPRAGACGSVFKILPNRKLNHRPRVKGGVLAEESAQIIKAFFRRKR